MIVDALILAGGRSSRLGHSDKWNLRIDDETLLQRSLRAVRSAGVSSVIVVGDEAPAPVVAVREDPAFAGPVAAIAAGMRALPGTADAVLVLACDMPHIAQALPALLAGFSGDGSIAVDAGRRQQLALLVDRAALQTALDRLPTVVDASMRDLLDGLAVTETTVPDGSTDDVDTWDDAARLGAVAVTGARS
ncbi:molybdenum cofactor guanylyltransferase [Pseudolysinimonas sp.]|uniref:molybdenum cofactor guanylyltransferase n=1 Tax=Pseudolysinimonas sp. TaxID=2680009 RepID=UPI003784D494